MDDFTYTSWLDKHHYEVQENAFECITQLGIGDHYCGFFKGWLHIEEDEGGYEVLWMNNKHYHNMIFESNLACSANFYNNGISHVGRAVLSWHPCYERAKASYYVNFLYKKLKLALKKKRK